MSDKTPQQVAAEESIGVINAAPNEEEKKRDLRSEMADARHDFPTPADYNKYIMALSQGLSEPLLHDVTIINGTDGFKTSDSLSGHILPDDAKKSQETVNDARALKALYAIQSVFPDFVDKLDTYHSDSGSNPIEKLGSRKDGNVGDRDLAAYLEDINVPAGSAKDDLAKISANDAEIFKRNLKTLKDSDKDNISLATITELENKLGISGENRRQQFEAIYGAADYRATPASQQNVEDGVIYGYGSERGGGRGFHRDSSGQIDAFNQTNQDGTETHYRRKPDGTWTQSVKEPGKEFGPETPWQGKAPFLDQDGNFGFYQQDPGEPNNPNKLQKIVFDKYNNIVLGPDNPASAVDLAGTNPDGTPVAITGLNRSVTLETGQSGTVGDLPVTYADGYQQVPGAPADATAPNRPNTHAEYTIANGTNLTEIARKVLHAQPGQPDPANLQTVIDQLAKSNHYDDPNLIPAGAQLVVPVDLAR